MAKRTETKTVERETEETYYLCDKCNGHFHEETKWKDDLNKVVFGAFLGSEMTRNGHGMVRNDVIEGEHEYLLCDRCYESAHDYLKDFF